MAFKAIGRSPDPHRRHDIAGRQGQQRSADQQVAADRARLRPGAVGQARLQQVGGEGAIGIDAGRSGIERRLDAARVDAAIGAGASVGNVAIAGKRPLPGAAQPAVQRDADMAGGAADLLPQRAGLLQIAIEADIVAKGGEGIAAGQGEGGGRQALQRIIVGQFQPAVDRRRYAAQRARQGRVGGKIFGRGAERAIFAEIADAGLVRAGNEIIEAGGAIGGAAGHAGDRDGLAGGGRQGRVDLCSAVDRGDIAGQRIGHAGRCGIDAALALQQIVGPAIFDVERQPIVAPDAQHADFALAIFASAIGGRATAQVDRGRAETLAQDDVHHLLRRRIAIGQGHFLWQDVDPRHRFGRQVGNFREAGNTLAVQQDDRRAIGLWRQFGDDFGNRRDAQRPDIGGRQLLFGLDVAGHRTALDRAGDDDLVALVHLGRRPLLLGLLRHQRAGRRAQHQ